MTITIFLLGIIIGWITKIPFLLKWYKNFEIREKHLCRLIDSINSENNCKELLVDIHNEWGENWDLIIDFFGQETADKIDKAVGYIKND